MKALEIVNVFKDYKIGNKQKFNALNDINISFEKGELVSIVGESGSGKSTLMNLIGGLDSDYEGIIKIDGKNLKDFKDKQLDDYRKKKIGFVFQSFNLIPHLSVLENVTIPLTLSNIKDSEKNERAITLLERLGLKDQIKKKPTQLSGGQKQRVAIARALINNPDIILADEPTGALDTTTTTQILEILKEIADEGKLVIMVTHSEKVASISSRIVEISDGKIVKDELKSDYKKEKTNVITKTENDEKNKKKEGHLSFLSALKLSFHNMWASKVKNILMAFGVSISLIAMILMLSFGSGLTGYITSQASQYSSPTFTTISKSGKDRNGNALGSGGMGGGFSLNVRTFNNNEINEIISEVNNYLEENNNEFKVQNSGENPNMTYGFNLITLGIGSNIVYQTDGMAEPKTQKIIDIYTTPPYYNETKLISKSGHISGENEIMLSEAACKFFNVEDADDVVGKEVTLNVNITINNTQIQIEKNVTVSAVVDISIFSDVLVMYVDYDYLDACVIEAEIEKGLDASGLSPSLLFIEADTKETKELIDQYIKTYRKDLSGSVEEQLEGMFNEMLSTFSIALAIISGISLFVALIMILVVLYMSVSERTREIGVLKSIGARKKDIRLIFSTESFLVGVLSGLTGCILAFGVGGIFSLVLKALLGVSPIMMMWHYFVIAFGISVAISVLAGLYPSSKAAKLDPVESLRRE